MDRTAEGGLELRRRAGDANESAAFQHVADV